MGKTDEEIVEDATIDCYGEYEQICGWVALLGDEINTPCKCKLGNKEAILEKIDSDDNGNCVVGIVRLGSSKIRVLFQDVVLEDPTLMNYVGAYKKWCGGN